MLIRIFLIVGLLLCASYAIAQEDEFADMQHRVDKASEYLQNGNSEGAVETLEGKIPDSLESGDGSMDFAGLYGIGYNNLGAAYLNLGEIKKAIIALNRSKEALPTWAAPHYLLGQAYCRYGMYEDSVQSFVRGMQLAINESNEIDYQFLIISYIKLGKIEDAQKSFDQAKFRFKNNFPFSSLEEVKSSELKEKQADG